MDGARLSRFPHLSWLHFPIAFGAEDSPFTIHSHRTCHFVFLNLRGTHETRWIEHGYERRWCTRPQAIHIGVATDCTNTTVLQPMSPDCQGFSLLIPRLQLSEFMSQEGGDCISLHDSVLPHGDDVIHASMTRLWRFRGTWSDHLNATDEAARALIQRVAQLSGGAIPDWHDDASVFDRRTLHHLVEYIDAHLRIAPSLQGMGTRVGLSPSHFAKKFRQSTGLSLHRFVNRRRIMASMVSLKDQSQPLAHVAYELGFSSQAHFTQLFSTLTGMTPAKYRKQFKRVVG